MPRIVQNRISNSLQTIRLKKKPFQCRVCKSFHPLRICRKFLAMDVHQRKQAVQRFKYCINCLAHKHSQPRCFSDSGCHLCQRKHHTLLHRRDRRDHTRTDGTNRSSSTDMLSHQMITVLPTALVKISHNGRLHQIRALIDTGSATSRIARSFVTRLDISTSRVGESEMCRVVVRAHSDRHARISACVRVDNRISMITPNKSLPVSFKDKFINLILADPNFFESSPIAMVIGADLYPKVILVGVMPSHEGIPMAQNSIFGWLISGTCPV